MNNDMFPYRKLAGRFLYMAAGAVVILVFAAAPASASSGEWRPVYDEVMLWVNFFILAFIIVKYGRKPLMNFLNGQKDEIADQIHRLQKEKNALEAKIKKATAMIEDSSIRFEEIKTRIIADGERTKQEIVENAKAQSKNILEAEKLKASTQIVQAKTRFISELVDQASALALSKLPTEVTAADQVKLQQLFIANIPRVGLKSA